jgi:lysozyme
MNPSTDAYELIKSAEGFSAVVYDCPAGHATIGYGHKLHDGPATDNDKRLLWSSDHAQIILERDTLLAAQAVDKAVTVPLNQHQFDALVSWTYNMGAGYLNAKSCTWLRELNNGNYEIVPSELKKWNKGTVKGILTVLPGLDIRRKKEAELFEKPYPIKE